MKDNAIKKGIIYFLIGQLVHFWICLYHKVKPAGFNGSVPSHIVESLSKEVSTASWSGSLQIFMLGITKKPRVQTKQKKKKENKHTYDMFQPMFTTWADHQTLSLILAFTTHPEFCQCTKRGKEALKQKERTKEKERQLLKAGNLRIWSVRHSSDLYVLTDSG